MMGIKVTYDPGSDCITLEDERNGVTVSSREYQNASDALGTDPEFRKQYGVFRTRYLLRRFLERYEATDGLA